MKIWTGSIMRHIVQQHNGTLEGASCVTTVTAVTTANRVGTGQAS